MGPETAVVRAKRTEFSFISTKNPFVFFENNMEALRCNSPVRKPYPLVRGPTPGEWIFTTSGE
jgi:hypothetical protein